MSLSPVPRGGGGGIILLTDPLELVNGAELLLGAGGWASNNAANAGAAYLAAQSATIAYVGLGVVGAGANTKVYIRPIGSTADPGLNLGQPQAFSMGVSVSGFPTDTVGGGFVIVNSSGQFQFYSNYSGGSDDTIWLYGYQ